MSKKLKCERCGGTEFAVAEDKSNKHYCQSCGHIFVPGVEGLSRSDVTIRKLREENEALKAEVVRVRAQLSALENRANK